MFKYDTIEEIVELLSSLDNSTKVYLGCDSTVFIKKGKRYARYATVCIVHKNGNNGCKLFSHVDTELDYDSKKNKPKLRMMNEVRKVCELYNQLYPLINEFEIEIHLDINIDKKHGSYCALEEATNYVLSSTGLTPKLKPESWSASTGADRISK